MSIDPVMPRAAGARPALHVFALNSGSSSLKFGLYRIGASQVETLLSETVSSHDQRDAIVQIGQLLATAKMPAPDAVGPRIVHAFVILRHNRRRLVSIAVTAHPTAEWIARQITEAFPWQKAPRYLLRDRDSVYGEVVRQRLDALGIRDRPIAARSPWQNGYVERFTSGAVGPSFSFSSGPVNAS